MKRLASHPLYVTIFLLSAGCQQASPCTATGTSEARRPFPQHTAYLGGGTLPSPDQRELDRGVEQAYSRWKQRWLRDGEEGTCRVLFDGTAARSGTVSEGQGYGMVIVATLAGYDPDAKAIFDALWAYAQQHPSLHDPNLMDWHVPGNGKPEEGDDDSAFDGDADIAYALLLADRQWGSEGLDYSEGAVRVIDALANRVLGPDTHLPMLGDWVDPDGEVFNQDTVRTSDFMPTHFRAFAEATGDSRWTDAVAAVHTTNAQLSSEWAPETGLLPDFVSLSPTPSPSPPNFLESEADGAYGYNAGRDPWRLGLDALLYDDATSRAQAVAISTWMEANTDGDPQRITTGYHLDGTPLAVGEGFTSFFAAPVGVAAMSQTGGSDWVDAVWSSVVDAEEGYYEDSVALQCLIAMSGNAWAP